VVCDYHSFLLSAGLKHFGREKSESHIRVGNDSLKETTRGGGGGGLQTVSYQLIEHPIRDICVSDGSEMPCFGDDKSVLARLEMGLFGVVSFAVSVVPRFAISAANE